MSSAIERERTRLLDGQEKGMLGGYGFSGPSNGRTKKAK